MRILFIAPLPPPVNGQAVVSKRLLEHLRRSHDVTAIDIRKQGLREGLDSATRIVEVLRTIWTVFRERRKADVVYLTIAESLAGNLKDLVICVLCFRLRSRTILHLHGGSLRRLLYDRRPAVYRLNQAIFGRVAGAIVSGPSHLRVFEGILDARRVHIAANYAPEEIVLDEARIDEKFAAIRPLRLLYISHMTEMKGYRRLLEAYLSSSETVKTHLRIDFAGAFDGDADRAVFLDALKGEALLVYHGVVDAEAKRALFHQAHVFCLPTAHLEGQPISILEAYAAGCVVAATGQPGIHDIFTSGRNGYEPATNTPSGIGNLLERLVADRDGLHEIASRNRRLAATEYEVSTAMTRIGRIIETAGAA
jgi:glycosyltransferase involved in cell wall biosynthesis